MLFVFRSHALSPPIQRKNTALVTGANRGIGKEVVRQLSALGYQVYLGSRDEAQGQKAVDELASEGLSNIHVLALDVTSDDSVKQAFDTLSSKIDALDVLVNNAGIAGDGWVPQQGYKPIDEDTLSNIKNVFEVNVFGALRVTQAFVPLLKKAKTGARIVNVGSITGSIATMSDKNGPLYAFNSLAYFPSKSALNSITAVYAKALEEHGIKVNAVCPGYTATEINAFQGHPVDVGAQIVTKLATLGPEGPTGTFQNNDGIIPW